MAKDEGQDAILQSTAPEKKAAWMIGAMQRMDQLSITYCYCCGGHVKHHLQIALGRSLGVEVLSSALSSGWKKPCIFLFGFAE